MSAQEGENRRPRPPQWLEAMSPEERRERDKRFLLRHVEIDPESGCWIWQGKKNSDGYGVAQRRTAGLKRYHATHRLAYRLWKGPIPTGLTIDHLCHTKDCCNPAHLEPVTPGENTRRMWEHRRLTGWKPPKRGKRPATAKAKRRQKKAA